jgi:hypothetical protein
LRPIVGEKEKGLPPEVNILIKGAIGAEMGLVALKDDKISPGEGDQAEDRIFYRDSTPLQDFFSGACSRGS